MCSRPPVSGCSSAPESHVLHPLLGFISHMLGSWKGIGKGQYPGVAPFAYEEEIVFSHNGKPFLIYQQKSWNQESKVPMHTESGYLRVVIEQEGAPVSLELLVSDPTGSVQVYQGKVFEDPTGDMVIEFESTSVTTTPSAKPVQKLVRRYQFAAQSLSYTTEMEACGQTLQTHLVGSLKRVSPTVPVEYGAADNWIRIKAEELKDHLDEYHLYDLREPDEYAVCTIPGTVANAPLGNVIRSIARKEGQLYNAVQDAQDGKKLLLYCGSSFRSSIAIKEILQQMKPDRQIFELAGGFGAWKEATNKK